MQDDSGLKRILGLSWGYKLFQAVIGAKQAKRWINQNFWQVRPGQKVLDIGCGPGVIVNDLPPDVRYVGFDISEEYIAHARTKFANDPNKSFVVGTASDFVGNLPERMKNADLVIMNGLLHHLDDDEARTALQLSYQALAPQGRLVCLEGCFLMRQAPIDRWLLSQDRGQNVRSESEWKSLVCQVFHNFETYILTGLLRIPYTHIVIVAKR